MISKADVRAGKCFLTTGAKPQVLRVRTVADAVVEFEIIGKPARAGRTTGGRASLGEFLDGLSREVGCDFEVGPQRLHI